MNRNTRLIFVICLLAVGGVILLQSLWISNYYQVNKERFEKEVNLAFEEAVKEEFKLRCDTLEDLIYQLTIDTARVNITSRWNEKDQVNIYYITNKKDSTDQFSFSSKFINQPIRTPLDSIAREVARHFAELYRKQDLEKHIVFFRLQNVGEEVDRLADYYAFDTLRLRPILENTLAAMGIREPFLLQLSRDEPSLLRKKMAGSGNGRYPIVTRALPTWKEDKNANFVSAAFSHPFNYLLGKMTGIIVASAVLLGVVTFALLSLLRIIRREKKLSAIKNDFISNISHELKTPIATVAAAVEALEGFDALQNPQRTKRYLQISRTELQRLADMVNKILNIARYERQEFELKPEPVNIDDIMEELIGKYSLWDEKHISFQYSNKAGTSTVTADQLHLYNVINNLVDNAVKYSGPQVTIDICFYREKQYYIVQVKDDGIGIAASDLPYIFDKFYRVPSGNIHKIKGHGLGLSYVKHIMEKQGGWCIAESRPGKGSTFKLAWQI